MGLLLFSLFQRNCYADRRHHLSSPWVERRDSLVRRELVCCRFPGEAGLLCTGSFAEGIPHGGLGKRHEVILKIH